MPRYCLTEKLSCRVAVELLPTQKSKSEGSTTQPFFAARRNVGGDIVEPLRPLPARRYL
jgi:hypothetical protein